jgi:hypothetical protein
MKVVDVPEPVINRTPVALTFNDVDEDTCYNRYRFLKPDLRRLHKALKLDEFEDGYIRVGSPASPSKYNKYGTEEALLIFLHRLAFPTRLADMVSLSPPNILKISSETLIENTLSCSGCFASPGFSKLWSLLNLVVNKLHSVSMGSFEGCFTVL